MKELIRHILKEESSSPKGDKIQMMIDKFGSLKTILAVGGYYRFTKLYKEKISKEQKIELIVDIVKEYGDDGYYIDVRYYDIFIDIDINFTDSNDYLTEVIRFIKLKNN
jgi:hypothetical protein